MPRIGSDCGIPAFSEFSRRRPVGQTTGILSNMAANDQATAGRFAPRPRPAPALNHPNPASPQNQMFTGLVETMGRLVDRIDQPPGQRLRIDVGDAIARDAAIGDSICCSGCCLTVIAASGTTLDFEAGEETLARTNLGRLRPGDPINLERSLPAGGRLGGHYVSGHIDALAELLRVEPDPPWAKLWFRVPQPWAAQIASKGSVALDGVSLTVVDVVGNDFSVALIPHTLAVTTLGVRQPGDRINLETDILAKYIERQLEARGLWPSDKPADS